MSQGRVMNQPIIRAQTIARLKEHGLPYGALALQNGVSILITQRGGWILGPFLSQDGESIFWMNDAFADAAAFSTLLKTGEWNLGGDRVWIAPESQYHIRDRAAFSEFLINIDVVRQSGFYVWKIILPLIILVAISWSVFWMVGDSCRWAFPLVYFGSFVILAGVYLL